MVLIIWNGIERRECELDNISIYFCSICDSHIGLFFRWDEIDDEKLISCCCVCGSDDIKFVKDMELSNK